MIQHPREASETTWNSVLSTTEGCATLTHEEVRKRGSNHDEIDPASLGVSCVCGLDVGGNRRHPLSRRACEHHFEEVVAQASCKRHNFEVECGRHLPVGRLGRRRSGFRYAHNPAPVNTLAASTNTAASLILLRPKLAGTLSASAATVGVTSPRKAGRPIHTWKERPRGIARSLHTQCGGQPSGRARIETLIDLPPDPSDFVAPAVGSSED
jgi:hypothetical protein